MNDPVTPGVVALGVCAVALLYVAIAVLGAFAAKADVDAPVAKCETSKETAK